jgi:hypothetical protein
MSRRPVPSVNASLIHEARMVLQHFLGNRQRNHYSPVFTESRAKPPVCIHPVLKCSFCVEGPVDATVVMNGYSTCDRHQNQAKSMP